jgi:SAM-dependent methyltransferase
MIQPPADWWRGFFDHDYLLIARAMFPESVNFTQAQAIWDLLGLEPGVRVLNAPCGYGRIARLLAERGALVTGADFSAVMIDEAERTRGPIAAQLHYWRHDLRTPLPESGFDVVLNLFTSFGYGPYEDDLALFRSLHGALRAGGRLLVETNHRDLMCGYLARGARSALRFPDGTLFLDQPEFDPLTGLVRLHWYWSGPGGAGEKHAHWRAYTPTEIVGLLETSGFRLLGAYEGLTGKRFAAQGPDVGGRLALLCERPA